MSLPDVAACKRYLKIENTAEDTLLAELLARALALSQRRIGCPFVAVSKTMVDRGQSDVFNSRGVASLLAPMTPFDPESITVADGDDVALDMTLLSVDGDGGFIRYADGSRFTNGPYTLVADVGLDTLPEYATEIEPLAGQAIVDFVAALYQQRSPSSRGESAAGGLSRSWTPEGIPCRVADVLDMLRRPL